MLPRKLIMDYPFFVKECLLTRYPPLRINLPKAAEDIIYAIDNIKKFGDQSLFLLKEIESLREEKNNISGLFKNASKEEKLILKEKNNYIKDKLKLLESEREKLENDIYVLEMSLPNIPDRDAILWDGYSDDDKNRLKTALSFINDVMFAYNSIADSFMHEYLEIISDLYMKEA